MNANQRLTALMQARLRELGMKTWRDLSVRAGISYETLRALRAGSNPSDGTAYALEKALQWEDGSIRAILAGREPTPAHQAGGDVDPLAGINVRADADPRILSILRNPVFTDQEKAWMIEALPRREPKSRRESDTG